MTAPIRRPVPLADVLNTVFGADVTTAAEARAWLRAGGWERLDSWIASRRSAKNDPIPEEIAR